MFCPISFLYQFQIHVLKTEDTMVKKRDDSTSINNYRFTMDFCDMKNSNIEFH